MPKIVLARDWNHHHTAGAHTAYRSVAARPEGYEVSDAVLQAVQEDHEWARAAGKPGYLVETPAESSAEPPAKPTSAKSSRRKAKAPAEDPAGEPHTPAEPVAPPED
jgi:hypothetical protein